MDKAIVSLICPLCSYRNIREYHKDQQRDYYFCEHCHLVFIPPQQRITLKQEKAIYDLHQNHEQDAGYRRFLSRLYNPLLKRLQPHMCGLDFGCGPGAALAAMLREEGYSVDLYDPLYQPHTDVFKRRYDFITCTEVLEHMYSPMQELTKLDALLKAEGRLAVMTKLVIDARAFANWHYKNDPTHVCFFSKETFRWIANGFNCHLEFVDKDVIFLQKRTKSCP